MTKKKIILLALPVAALLVAAFAAWKFLAAPTRIAFVNYQPIVLGEIAQANDNSFIRIENLPVENLDKASRYDMVFVNGMGLRVTEEQREALQKAADSGTPVLTTAATNPQNLIVSIDSVDTEFAKQYLQGGGRTNYRSLLNYVRRYIDGKRCFVKEMKDPQAAPSGMFYHPDPEGTRDGVTLWFDSLEAYRAFLAKSGLGKQAVPSVILTGQMGVPDELIARLEARGLTVYPLVDMRSAVLSGVADSIAPAAVINMAHGRLGDGVVDYLTRNNMPMFAPLNVNRDFNEWMDDRMGMNGGFMSQSIVTPEIDGALRPWALFAQFESPDGLPRVKAIPGRLEEFVETVGRHVALRSKAALEKKLAIFYFKGPGQNALVAEGMEVGPSLYNLLVRLREEGYNVDGLPSSAEELEKMLAERGRVFGSYAEGAMADFVRTASPQIVTKEEYDQWTRENLGEEMAAEVEAVDGPFPGAGLHTADGSSLALARLQFGNIVLIPQTAAGVGNDDFRIVHGTDMAPPHAYVASYLWARNGFGADAILHFGAHGSLEFTPRKQVALGSRDWPDRLIGSTPHFYVWSTSNVGEAMMAKRRSYAGIINHLTPPFMESGLRGVYKELSEALAAYSREVEADAPDARRLETAAAGVKKHAIALGIHRELRLDSTAGAVWSEDEVARIASFAEELANEKITGAHYILGRPYAPEHISSTVYAMTVDPVAYSLYALDRQRGRASAGLDTRGAAFTRRYLAPARALVSDLLRKSAPATDEDICRIAGISLDEYEEARKIVAEQNESKELFSRMMVMGSSMPVAAPTAKLADRKDAPASKMKKMMGIPGMSPEKALEMARKMGADSAAIAKMSAAMKRGGSQRTAAGGGGHPHGGMPVAPARPQAEVEKAVAIMEIDRTVRNVSAYAEALAESPRRELDAVVNALVGGYIEPTSGGDPVLNPLVLPTGRNMFAVNAEETPSAAAWEKGKALVDNTLKMYRKAHSYSLPRKVSYTLWSSEFIETEGATIAQVLYMLGVEPVRDPFGRVTDLRIIPSEELGRPRIDVVVQTSGQLRDLAASRLFLIGRAVRMAAEAADGDDTYPNYVKEGILESERHLVDRGVSPKEAREMSTARVFGGVNGNYGSGIQEMVEAGDRWDDDSQIAETYIHNMGASYGSEEDWEKLRDYAFEAALTRTDVVVQPRQSNTWGALSLDHVYEFMGGMNLAVRNVTGKDPEAYLADYRNRSRSRMQEVKEAIGVESRTTILNPAYIRERMKGGAGDASEIADVVRNTYGWNVMKPAAIDNELWNDIFDTYVRDASGLGTKEYFKDVNPAALQEMTAVMLETARKGLWKASDEQLASLARLHTEVVGEFGPACSGFVCNNPKLQEYIAGKVDAKTAADYRKSVAAVRAENVSDADGMVLKKEALNDALSTVSRVSGPVVAAIVVVLLVLVFIIIRRRRGAAGE